MTVSDPGRGRPRSLVPFGLRRRASLLYEGRRRRLLEEPLAALRAAGMPVEVSPDARMARTQFDGDVTVEVGFVGNARLFGVLIDTMWVARRGEPGPSVEEFTFRFDKGVFTTRSKDRDSMAMAEHLSSDAVVAELTPKAEVKRLTVRDSAEGRQVELIPLPGTITAVFIPPMPPYVVPIRPEEAAMHLRLVRRLLDL